jgi:ribosomal-protein-alanine N-acetyltransferase
MTGSEPVLRGVGPEDGPRLARLQNACFPDEPWPASGFTALLDGPGVFGLSLEPPPGAAPAGLWGFLLCRVAADEGELLSVGVAPAARRQGLGARLLTEGLSLMALAGAVRVVLEVAEDNVPAETLYRRAGFVPVGRRANYYQRPGGRVAAKILALDLFPAIAPAAPPLNK